MPAGCLSHYQKLKKTLEQKTPRGALNDRPPALEPIMLMDH